MIYVDDLREYPESVIKPGARKYGARWAHLTADTREELHAFAEQLGLKRSWFQEHRTLWHYDLTPAKWKKAMKLGAIHYSTLEMAREVWCKRVLECQPK
jgi:hypothetical protein